MCVVCSRKKLPEPGRKHTHLKTRLDGWYWHGAVVFSGTVVRWEMPHHNKYTTKKVSVLTKTEKCVNRVAFVVDAHVCENLSSTSRKNSNQSMSLSLSRNNDHFLRRFSLFFSTQGTLTADITVSPRYYAYRNRTRSYLSRQKRRLLVCIKCRPNHKR